MSEHEHGHEEGHAHSHHITPPILLFGVYIALTILMLLTVAVVYYPFPSSFANNAVNLGIAVMKASLVVMFFMGVKYTTKLTKTWAYAGFIWLTLMGIIFGDYMTRGWQPVKGWYGNDSASSAPISDNASPLYRNMPNSKAHSGDEGPKASDVP